MRRSIDPLIINPPRHRSLILIVADISSRSPRYRVDREATIAALVDAYAESRLDPEGAERTRAVLTGWNKDVRELNARIRDRLKHDGLLPEGEEVEIAAIPRGGNRAETLALTVGDEVIFGESVEVEGQTIRNADLARVEALSGDPGDPVLTLRLAKNGARLSARASALVGFRERGEARDPRLQHSYAMSTHAAQGVTVDESFVADLRGTGAEATYVAMTRHRRTARLFVDTDRIRERLEAARSGIRPEERGLPDSRGAAHPDLAPVSHSEIRQAFLSESAGSAGKANVADFAGGDLRAWCGAPIRSRDVPVRSGGRMGLEREGAWREAIAGIAPAPEREPSQAAQALRQRMDERLHALAAYPAPSIEHADRTIPLAPDGRRQRNRIRRLAAILWQGLKRQVRITVGAVDGALPRLVERLSADLLLDPSGRLMLVRRDPLGHVVGIERGREDRAGTAVSMPPCPTGLIQLGDRRAPRRIYVGRTEREALGLYQQDELPDRSLLCVLGDDGPESDSALTRIVAQHPAAAVHLAIDERQDKGAAQAFEARVLAALREVQTPEAGLALRRSVPLEPSSSGGHTVPAEPLLDQKDRKRQREEQRALDHRVKRQVSRARSLERGSRGR